MSDYLSRTPRSLHELRDEIQNEIDTLEMEAFGDDNPAQFDNRLADLHDRLDDIEEEIAWADRREERRDTPITL
jgi:cobalamin biosynthesis Mg chelatase CobN